MVLEELPLIFDAREFDQPDPEPEIQLPTSAASLAQNGHGGTQRLRPLMRSFPWDEPLQRQDHGSPMQILKPSPPILPTAERKTFSAGIQSRGVTLYQIFDSLIGADALRITMVAVLTLLCSLNMICLTAAKQAAGKDSFGFEYVTVTLAQETAKFFVAAFCFQVEMWNCSTNPTGQLSISTLRNVNFLQYGIPGLLYCFDNNFQYVILGFLQPAELTILWNFKIFATTLLLHAFLNRRYSQRQWVSMALLVFGCAATQASDLFARYSADASVTLAHAASPVTPHLSQGVAVFPEADPGAFSGELPQQQPSKVLGMGLALFGSSIAASGNVFCEYLVKERLDDSIHLQNMQLYFFGILLNLGTLFVKALTDADSPIHGPDGFFTGYNGWVWTVIVISAIHGIVISATLKYVDNIAVIFAHALSMVVVAVVSAEFFQLALSVSFVFGGFLVLVALWMFYSDGHDIPERRPSESTCKPLLTGQTHANTECHMYCLDSGF